MSKRISKETLKRLKRNRARKYRRKMALRNQPRTTQEKADAAAHELAAEDQGYVTIVAAVRDSLGGIEELGGGESAQVVR